MEVPVVEAANTPQPAEPKRTSLPSMLPPPWSAVTVWLAPTWVSRSLPRTSMPVARATDPIHSRNMVATITHPCRLSFTIRP